MNKDPTSESRILPEINTEDAQAFLDAIVRHYAQHYMLALKRNEKHQEAMTKKVFLKYLKKRRE